MDRFVPTKKKRKIYRLEDHKGLGPFFGNNFLPKEVHDRMYKMLDGYIDFKGSISSICANILKARERRCVYGFPSYRKFKEYVGKYEKHLAPFLKIYETDRFVISRSRHQVLFVRETRKIINK